MFKKIYKEIKKYSNIVIVRHVGVDPDALSSQLALRDSIKLTFPNKNVIAIGTGSAKFTYIGKLDKTEKLDDSLLIVVDTPDKKRIDGALIEDFKSVIKIDHHPFVEKFGELEYIDDTACSACEIIMRFLEEVPLKCDSEIAKTLYTGLVADSNRFLFNSCTPATFNLCAEYIGKYDLNINEIYQKMYLREMKEVRFEGYIALNMVITDSHVGYIKITDELLTKFNVDSASAGNMVNNFNFINDYLVWLTITEDLKNETIRVSIRSRGPEINHVAEKYHGGGHKFASGARVTSFDEADLLIADLNRTVDLYLKNKEDA